MFQIIFRFQTDDFSLNHLFLPIILELNYFRNFYMSQSMYYILYIISPCIFDPTQTSIKTNEIVEKNLT